MPKKVLEKESGELIISKLSFSDLFAMYQFVMSNRNRCFSSCSVDTKILIDGKVSELEQELYKRSYGKDPFDRSLDLVFEGKDPVKINLEQFDAKDKPEFLVVKEEKQEIKDEQPKTFAVFKNE